VLAIVLIFSLAFAGWNILGVTSWTRSHNATSALDHSVRALWGSPIVQPAPSVETRVPGSTGTRRLIPVANEIELDFRPEHRRKGLVWYPTYVDDFKGRYTIRNEIDIAHAARLHFAFPSKSATYEALGLHIDGQKHDVDIDTNLGIRRIIPLAPGATRSFELSYRTRGLRSWRYRLAPDGGRTKNLKFTMKANFSNIDFPEDGLSPKTSELLGDGIKLLWASKDFVTKQDIGLLMLQRINPGPLSARKSFFAPVCLLFYFVLISAICILRKIDIHPMHYLFVSAGFFAFHLLFAYLVDGPDKHTSRILGPLRQDRSSTWWCSPTHSSSRA